MHEKKSVRRKDKKEEIMGFINVWENIKGLQ